MAATIEVFQERTNIEGGHRVLTRVDAATGIPRELFVFVQSDDTFSHVCAVEDFFYPTTNTVGFTNYRKSTVTRDFPDIDTALRYATHVKDRLLAITEAYTADAADFAGSETSTYG